MSYIGKWTDLNTLPVGTKFWVHNGYVYAKIAPNENGENGVVLYGEDKWHPLKPDLVNISIITEVEWRNLNMEAW